jgi:hypothetical protein
MDHQTPGPATTAAEPEPASPIRDDPSLGATEDLDRLPDVVPRDVVGGTLFAAFGLVVAALAMYAAAGCLGALVVAGLAVPVLVLTLRSESDRERDPAPPLRG